MIKIHSCKTLTKLYFNVISRLTASKWNKWNEFTSRKALLHYDVLIKLIYLENYRQLFL